MRLAAAFLGLLLSAPLLCVTSGCGPQTAEVAPRTPEEVEAFKAEVYGAEEEDEGGEDE